MSLATVFCKTLAGVRQLADGSGGAENKVDEWDPERNIGIIGVQAMISCSWTPDLVAPGNRWCRLACAISEAEEMGVDGEIIEAYVGFHANTDEGKVRAPFWTPNTYNSEIVMFPPEYEIPKGSGSKIYLHLAYDNHLGITVACYGYAHVYYVKR